MVGCNADCDWGHGGHLCSDCFKVTPCCGDPCGFSQCLYCYCCYLYCLPCVLTKLYASSLDETATVFSHGFFFLIYFFLLIVVRVLLTVTAQVIIALVGEGAVLPVVFSMQGAGLFIAVLGIIALYWFYTILRLSLRRKYAIGSGDCQFCDCFCFTFTGACQLCQLYRTVPVEDWDWLGQCQTTGCPLSNGRPNVCGRDRDSAPIGMGSQIEMDDGPMDVTDENKAGPDGKSVMF